MTKDDIIKALNSLPYSGEKEEVVAYKTAIYDACAVIERLGGSLMRCHECIWEELCNGASCNAFFHNNIGNEMYDL